MHIPAILGAVGAAAALAFFASSAEAAQPPRVNPGDCAALAAAHGPSRVWQTTFYGDHRDLWDNIDHYSAAPCFASEEQCKAWLYWAQSDWPDRNNTTFCRRGIRY